MKLKTLILTPIIALSFANLASAQFKLPELPYATNALEAAIDQKTMEIHHGKHHAGYVNNLNAAIKGTEAEKMPLEKILASVSKFSPAVRNNAGGHYNHTLFWQIMTPKAPAPSATFTKVIEQNFGSMDKFRTAFADTAAKRFGSGWAWLIVGQDGKLKITSTANQNNPLMDIERVKGTPVLGLDVWEHAYYLRYQNKRPDYISAWWSVVNWKEVERRYNEAKK